MGFALCSNYHRIINTFEGYFSRGFHRLRHIWQVLWGSIWWAQEAGQDFGYYTIGIIIKDQENNEAVKAFQLYILGSLKVDPPDKAELKATTGKEFSSRISASGGTVESYNYALSSKGDKLPRGLSFSDGLIRGKPETGTKGDYNIIIRAGENDSFRSLQF